MFKRLSIFPSLETITRIGYGICPRSILASRKSACGKPSRTLSRLSVLCPTRTASASARCRNKCSLSSREVKSTGEKFRVVTLPSTVIAKVAATNGRREMWERSGRRRAPRPSLDRETEIPPALFRFADFMSQRRDFFLHLAQLHVCDHAARFVKEINNSPGQAADENNEKTE